MAVVGRIGEELARSINRRSALKRVAAAAFGAVAAWSVEGIRKNSALADHCAYVTAGDCSCNPPYGTYCTTIDPSYCSGSSCSGGCVFDESWRYVGACWCSATCEYTAEDGSPTYGYYRCCDCNCYGTQCSCREFVPGGSSTHDDGSDTLVPPPADSQDGTTGPVFPPGFGDDSDNPVVVPGGGVDFPRDFPFQN